MTITYKIAGVTLTNRVRLMEEGEGFVTAAERGAVATGGVLIDDDDASLTINGWQTFTVDDDEAFPYSRVFTGFIVERNIGRNARYRTSTARVHDCAILDVNAYLHLRVLRANASKRPAETDVARVTWLLTSEALAGVVFDRGLVSSANAGSYLEADTRRRFADDVMGELAPSAVKNFFVYQDNATASPGLFYGRDTLAAYTSTLRISNVAADVDNVVTFAPSADAVMQRQPNDWYGGVSYGWRGDPIYVQSATTIAAMGIQRDAVYDTDRVGILATAQQAAKDWLNVRATEADFITVTLILPSARINDIYAGQRIQVKFSHIPGYTSFVYTRVRRRSVKPSAPQFWEMRLELWVPAVPVSDAALTAACATPTFVQKGYEYNSISAPTTDVSLPVASTSGNVLIAAFGMAGAAGVSLISTGWNTIVDGALSGAASYNYLYWKVSAGDQTITFNGGSSVAVIAEYTFPAALIEAAYVSNRQDPGVGSATGPTVTYGNGARIVLGVCFADDGPTGADNASVTAPGTLRHPIAGGDAPAREIYFSDRLLTTASTAGTTSWNYVNTGTLPTLAIGVALYCSNSDAAPAPLGVKDWVSESLGFGNGTKTAWTTTWPFDDGSLTVFVDRLDQTAAVTITSAAAGTFSIGYAPLSSELVEVTYRGR